MKEEIYDDLFEEKEEKTNWQAMLFKYIIRWPWFIASVIFCLVCAWLYLKTITPVYNISASMIIKDNKKGGNTGNDLSAFEDLGIISSSQNIDNEIEILRSKSLIKDVVSELGLYISYSGEGRFQKPDLYGSSPVLVHFLPEDAERLKAPHLADRQLSVRQPDRCNGNHQWKYRQQAFHGTARCSVRRGRYTHVYFQSRRPHYR